MSILSVQFEDVLYQFDDDISEEDVYESTIESVEFYADDPNTALVQVANEKVLNNAKDKFSPDTGKVRITVLGLGFKGKFSTGETVPADANSLFKSEYMKEKFKEFDNYYINEKGYRPFTKADESRLKLDKAQLLRKIFQFNVMNKVSFNYIDGHGLWGLWNWALGEVVGKNVRGTDQTVHGVDKNIVSFALASLIAAGFNIVGHVGALNPVTFMATQTVIGKANNSFLSAPYCIAYIKPAGSDGKEHVLVRRILVAGFFTKTNSRKETRRGSGGKDIGYLKD
jgi:hypothetical protein